MGSAPSVNASEILQKRQQNLVETKQKQELNRKIAHEKYNDKETKLKASQLRDATDMAKTMLSQIVKWLEKYPTIVLEDLTGRHDVSPGIFQSICYAIRDQSDFEKPLVANYYSKKMECLENQDARWNFEQEFFKNDITCVMTEPDGRGVYWRQIKFSIAIRGIQTMQVTRETKQVKELEETRPSAPTYQVDTLAESTQIETVQTKSSLNATCAICSFPYGESSTILPCMHIFCTQCVVSLIEKSNGLCTCPKCRREFTAGMERAVYL